MPCGATCTGWLCRRPGAEMWSLAHRDFLSLQVGLAHLSQRKKERSKITVPRAPVRIEPRYFWTTYLCSCFFLCSPHFWILDIGYFNFCEGFGDYMSKISRPSSQKMILAMFCQRCQKRKIVNSGALSKSNSWIHWPYYWVYDWRSAVEWHSENNSETAQGTAHSVSPVPWSVSKLTVQSWAAMERV